MKKIAILLRGHCKRTRPESVVWFDPIYFNFLNGTMQRMIKYVKNPLEKKGYNIDFYCSHASESGMLRVNNYIKPKYSILETRGQNFNTVAGIDLVINSGIEYEKIIISRFDFLIKKPITFWWEKIANKNQLVFLFNEITPWDADSKRVGDVFHWINNEDNIIKNVKTAFQECAHESEGGTFHELRRVAIRKGISYGFFIEEKYGRFDSNTCHNTSQSCNPIYAMAGRNYYLRAEENFKHKTLFMK